MPPRPILEKALIMPETVPSKPSIGESAAMVDSRLNQNCMAMLFPSHFSSTASSACCLSSLSRGYFSFSIPGARTSARTLLLSAKRSSVAFVLRL